jgi:putative hydrolase of the HAD superfamily
MSLNSDVSLKCPQLICFDAVGTLFGVRGTVGEIYGGFARQAGLDFDTGQLNTAFIQSFRAAPRAAFTDASVQDLPRLEYEWWRAIARHSFDQVGALSQLPDFDRFFQPLFDHFAKADPWIIYPEVTQALAQLQALGIELAIVSNFDSRLDAVLEALDLAQYFTSVTLSTRVGSAKPEGAIFAAALAKYGCDPSQVWHVGDSWTEDYEGAIAFGLRGIWLNRDRRAVPETRSECFEIKDLTMLETILNS